MHGAMAVNGSSAQFRRLRPKEAAELSALPITAKRSVTHTREVLTAPHQSKTRQGVQSTATLPIATVPPLRKKTKVQNIRMDEEGFERLKRVAQRHYLEPGVYAFTVVMKHLDEVEPADATT